MALNANDIKILNDMRAEVKRLATKVDGIRGDGVSNSGRSLSISPPRQSAGNAPQNIRYIFPVKLTQTGGSAGTSSAQCSFTYTVKDITEGQTLGVSIAMTGNGNRIVNAAMTAGTYGLAYWFLDGTLKLIWCDERVSQTNCT